MCRITERPLEGQYGPLQGHRIAPLIAPIAPLIAPFQLFPLLSPTGLYNPFSLDDNSGMTNTNETRNETMTSETKKNKAAEAVQAQHSSIMEAIQLLQSELNEMTATTDPQTTS